MAVTAAPLKVRVFPHRPGLAYGNIMWEGAYPMRGGRFPATHPVGGEWSSSAGSSQCGESAAMKSFRALGYWASCFPEGDGITWQPLNGQDDKTCLRDIQECFGWRASWAPGVVVS